MHWTELRERATPIAVEKGFNKYPWSPTVQELIRIEACLEVWHGEPKFQVGDWVAVVTPFIGNRLVKMVTEIRWSDGYRYVTERSGLVREYAEGELVADGAWKSDPGLARRLAEKRY